MDIGQHAKPAFILLLGIRDAHGMTLKLAIAAVRPPEPIHYLELVSALDRLGP